MRGKTRISRTAQLIIVCGVPLLFGFLIPHRRVLAQAGGYGGYVFSLPFSGASLGTGRTNVVTARGYAALTSNPAEVGLSSGGAQVGFGTFVLPGGTKLQYVGISSWPRRVTVAVGLSEFYSGEIPSYDAEGNSTGQFDYTSTSFHSAVSFRMAGGVTVGIGSTVHEERVDGVPRGSVLSSVGAVVEVSRRILWGGYYGKTTYAQTHGGLSPKYWRGATGILVRFGSFAKVAMSVQSDPGGIGFGGGTEITPNGVWNVRLGWHRSGPTWGIGFGVKGLRVSANTAIVDQMALTAMEISLKL